MLYQPTLCQGDTLRLQAIPNDHYSHSWNTGEENSSIDVLTPGLYSVEIEYSKRHSKDSIYVNFEDCEVRFDMPNIFTPNGEHRYSTDEC